MTDAVQVEQVDREAACKFFGYDDEKHLAYWGNASNHHDVERLSETLARHRHQALSQSRGEGERVRVISTGETGVVVRTVAVVQFDEPDGSQGAMGGSVGTCEFDPEEIAALSEPRPSAPSGGYSQERNSYTVPEVSGREAIARITQLAAMLEEAASARHDGWEATARRASDLRYLLALTPASASPEVVESGWLIERRGQWWGPIYSEHEEKWAVDPRLWEHNWTNDPNHVVRFARKEDAEAQIKYHGWQGAVATAHQWISGARKALSHDGSA